MASDTQIGAWSFTSYDQTWIPYAVLGVITRVPRHRGVNPPQAAKSGVMTKKTLSQLLALACLVTSAHAWAQQPSPDAPPSAYSNGGITLPKLLKNVEPVYPPEAKAAGIEAEVLVTLYIDAQGHVTKATVPEPAGHGFDEAAIEAAQKLEFSPALRPDGTPFAVKFKHRYVFALPSPSGPAQGGTGTPSAQQASTTTFSGLVLASGGNAPIAGATVDMAPGGLTVTTDEAGAFAFPGLAPGKYTVLVRAAGYKALEVHEELAEREATEVKYRLVPSASGALEVTVEGRAPPARGDQAHPRAERDRAHPRHQRRRPPVAAEPARRGAPAGALRACSSCAGPRRRTRRPSSTARRCRSSITSAACPRSSPPRCSTRSTSSPATSAPQYGRVDGRHRRRRPARSRRRRLPRPRPGRPHRRARRSCEGPIPGLDGWTFLAAGRRS